MLQRTGTLKSNKKNVIYILKSTFYEEKLTFLFAVFFLLRYGNEVWQISSKKSFSYSWELLKDVVILCRFETFK